MAILSHFSLCQHHSRPQTSEISRHERFITHTASRTGFTMVEFTISMAFIAVLLIAIAIISSNMIALYQKGTVIKSIDDVGRSLIDELSSSISASPSINTANLCAHLASDGYDECIKDRADKFIFQQRYYLYRFTSEQNSVVQTAGMFCTGKYSYLWNTFYSLNKSGKHKAGGLTLTYQNKSGEVKTIEDFRLIRVDDPTNLVCSSVVNAQYATTNGFSNSTSTGSSSWKIDISKINGVNNKIDDPVTGFLHGSSLDLELYELIFYPISQDLVTLRTFMSGTFILATDRGNINITRTNNYCDVNNYLGDGVSGNALDLGSELSYCAINKFNFAARTAGR